MVRWLPLVLVFGLTLGCAGTSGPEEALATPSPDDLATSARPSQPTDTGPDPSPSNDEATDEAATPGIPTLDAWDQDTYLPRWVPDGYALETITRLDPPSEIQTADSIDSETLILGDSSIVSETSVTITARRFATEAELEHAVWVEDALMVQSGGPESTVAIEGAVVAYDGFPGPAGETVGGQFHVILDDVLVTGFILGPLDADARDQLLASLLITGDDELAIDVDHEAAGLIELDRADHNPDAGYELVYTNGSKRFLVNIAADRSEASVAAGAFSRSGERFDGKNGSGYFEAQPEVGGALGSERLVWWVPSAKVTVWFGGTLSQEEAVAVADSVAPVDQQRWLAATTGIVVERIDFGPMNLPENPREAFEARTAERDRPADEIGSRPPIDIADIATFIGELRGGALPDDLTVTWLAPLEADAATAGITFWPDRTDHVLLALGVVRPSDDPSVPAEARRQDVRGACCGLDGIQLVEGMEADEAAVVAAHEFTHFYDTQVLPSEFGTTDEVFDPNLALREGNANRVMIAYRDARGLRFNLDNRPHLQLDMAIGVRRALRFAYHEGQAFTEAVAEARGESAIDHAFTGNPPQSTEHILHPEHYLAGDQPEVVPAPAAPDGHSIEHQGTLGAFVLALAAERELGWDTAVELVGSWSGDSFVGWADDGAPCLAAVVRFDDADAAGRFADAVGAAATGREITIERCAS